MMTPDDDLEAEELTHPEQEPEIVPTQGIRQRLYISHLLSTWNSRAFEFGAILFVAACFPGTLLPTSAYALVRAASAVAFSPAVGRYIDTTDRLKTVRLSILLQRAAVIVSCAGFIVLWSRWASSAVSRISTLALLSLLGCIEKLASTMNLVSVERDWVVTIAQNDEDFLRVLNSQMRRIDLFCKLAGPLGISLLDGISTKLAVFFMLGSNLVTVGIEYFAIAKIYKFTPALQARSNQSTQEISHASPLTDRSTDLEPQRDPEQPPLSQGKQSHRHLCSPRAIISALLFYFRHPVFLPSMALSLLYCSVLSFSGQMVTYLLSAGYTSTHIGLMRTVSVIFEISATWICPRVMARFGPTRTALWGINWQLLWVGLAAVSVSISVSASVSGMTAGLIGGVIISRLGLWAFDLCVQILVQEEVEPAHRGRFSTLEASFQNGFELLSYTSTLVFAQPEQFQYPVGMSAVAVALASVLYAAFVRQRRGHLLHMPRCLELKDRGDDGREEGILHRPGGTRHVYFPLAVGE